jgi:hypothetical protein
MAQADGLRMWVKMAALAINGFNRSGKRLGMFFA